MSLLRILCAAAMLTIANTVCAFSFQPFQATPVGSSAAAVAVGDIDGDGRSDVLLATHFYFDVANDYHLFWFRQLASGSLESPIKTPHFGTYQGNQISLAAADVDNDGRAEVFVGGSAGNGVRRCEFENGAFACSATAVLAGNAAAITLADVDTDGNLDLLAGDCAGAVSIVDDVGSVSGTTSGATVAMPAGPCGGVHARDFDGDGSVDLATFGLYQPATALSLRFQLPGNLWSSPNTLGVPGSPAFSGHFGTTIDIGTDGLVDFVVSGGGNSPTNLHLYRQQVPGVIDAGMAFSTYDIPEAIKTIDLDLDEREDLVVLHGGWNAAGVYFGTQTGLSTETRFSIPYASHYDLDELAFGDINGDGCTDAVISDYNHGLVRLLGTGCLPPLLRDGFE